MTMWKPSCVSVAAVAVLLACSLPLTSAFAPDGIHRQQNPYQANTNTNTNPATTTCTTPSRYSNVSPLYMNKKKKRSSSITAGAGFGGAAATALSRLQSSTFPYAGSIRPGVQSPQKIVLDESIVKPDYWQTGTPSRKKTGFPWMIEVKTAEEIVKMRAAGLLAREVLDTAGRAVQVGVTTDEIDEIVHDLIVERGAYPSPLNYHGFPKSCCTSVNEVICHGIPDDRKLADGDIINIDITVYLNGYHGDCSEMFVAGNLDDKGKDLLQTTYDCWISSCNYVAPGRDYKDLGAIIEDYVVPKGYSSVRNFCGHGIGSVFHTQPNILHYRNSEPNGQMAEGHTFTIEPMICEKSAKALSWPDEWTATTVDGKRSAQFEHTLLIVKDGVEALTGKTHDSPLQFWERESKIHQGVWLGTSADARKRADEINAKLLD